jgi:hypothetical protein
MVTSGVLVIAQVSSIMGRRPSRRRTPDAEDGAPRRGKT